MPRGTREGNRQWPSKLLLEQVAEIAYISNLHRKKNDPRWTVVVAMMVAIYRGEGAKIKAIEDFNSMPPESQSNNSVIGYRDDEDFGD